jgi:hypothetical protein
MLFKSQREKRICWKIEIEGVTPEGKPNYSVWKARAPYGWDIVHFFNDIDQATRFVEKHLHFPKYFYEDHKC